MTAKRHESVKQFSDLLTARLGEMDAALEAIGRTNAKASGKFLEQAEDNLLALRETRGEMKKAARDAMKQNSKVIPSLALEVKPLWDEFEKALTQCVELTGTHDEVLSAQLKAQTKIWDELFDHYKGTLSSADSELRADWFQKLDSVSRKMTQIQIKAASADNSPWPTMLSAMGEARGVAEKAAEDFWKFTGGTAQK